MTRFAERKTNDWLHCTFSAMIDIFEMENLREPSGEEINKIILLIGDHGDQWISNIINNDAVRS